MGGVFLLTYVLMREKTCIAVINKRINAITYSLNVSQNFKRHDNTKVNNKIQ